MLEDVFTNPYIGPTAFTESDSARFFGRREETRELASLVIARRAVLLYAQSGSGKTSLLQASLIPELKRRKRVETFPIARVMGSADTSRNLYLESALAYLFPDAPDQWHDEALRKNLAWAFRNTSRQPQLLIFDQFEEIFTYHPELKDYRYAFFEQLGECLATYPQLSLLLSMREDYLADLEEYVSLLPDRMRTRMRLERLGVENALEAIREPAARAGLPFAPGTAEQLVDNLRRVRTGAAGSSGFALGPYVEPVQLQIVCRQLWSGLMADPSHGKTEIDAADIAAHANVDNALIQFYRDSLAKAQQAGVRERTLRRWFGEHLITPAGTRGLVLRGERETEGLPNAAVDILRDCYIIRPDPRGGNVWYELAHDRLVDPVREDNLAWKAAYRNPVAEALERGSEHLLTGSGLEAAVHYAEQNRDELTAEERLFLRRSQEAERQTKARRRTVLISAAAVIAVLAALSVWALGQKRYAEAQRHFAEGEARRAQDKEKEAEDATCRTEEAKQRAEQDREAAVTARKEAETQAALADSGRLAAAALPNKETRFDLAALLGVEGLRAADSLDSRRSLLLLLETTPRLRSIFHHGSGLVANAAFNQDGKTLASVSHDGALRLWDVASGKSLSNQKCEAGEYFAFSPDGSALATANETVRLWDLPAGRLAGVLEGSSRVVSLALGAGKALALADFSRRIKVWDFAKKQSLADIPGDVYVDAIALSPDGKLAVSYHDGPLQLRESVSGKPIGALPKAPSGIATLAFSPDGKLLAAGTWEKLLLLWDVGRRELLGDPLTGHTSGISSVAFSPNGRVLASGSWDNTVRLWDVANRKLLGEPLKGHVEAVSSVTFNRDGDLLASAGRDGTVRLWDVTTRSRLGLIHELVERPGPVTHRLEGHSGWVRSVMFSPNGKLLASAGQNGEVRFWDAEKREPLGGRLGGQGRVIPSVVFSPNGKIAASASDDQTVWLWDVNSRKRLDVISVGSQSVSDSDSSVALSPDGRILAAPSEHKTVRLWDMATRTVLGDLPNGPAVSVAFSPIGTLLAAASTDTVKLWDVSRRRLLGVLPDAGGTVAFSQDGRLLASRSHGTAIRIWDVATRQPLGNLLSGHTKDVYGVAFSPDGKLLASASLDHSVILWDVTSRQPLGDPLKGHSDSVHGVAFSPDSKTLASASDDGAVLLWDVDPNSWAAQLCRMANRNLSLAEWQQYIGRNIPYRRTCPALPPGDGAPGK